MTVFWSALAFFSGTFTFAFGMAWMIPLSVACREKRASGGKPSPRELMEFWLDLLLMAADSIPLFALVRGVRELPANLVVAREKWRTEAGIRWSFKAFCVSLCLLVVGVYGAFWT